MHQDLLFTIAEVSVTLAGFSGVVFILGSRAEGRFSEAEKNGLFHLLFITCGNMLVALMVAGCLSFSVSVTVSWRIGCAAIGLFVLTGCCTSAKDMAPNGPFSKRDFSAGCFSSLAC
jgi:hypothetical protein